MSTHTIQTEVEVELADGDNAYPTIEITFDYAPGYTPKTPPGSLPSGPDRGEYAPIDPPVAANARFRHADLLDDAGLKPDFARVQKWGETYMESEAGYQYCCDCAETDLLATRTAHMEYRHEQ